MKNLLLIFICATSVFIFSCNKCKNIACLTPPQPLRIKILDNNNKNISDQATFTLTYKNNLQYLKVDSLHLAKTDKNEFYLTSSEIGFLSGGQQHIQTFYLNKNETQMGILTYVVENIHENCCSYSKEKEIIFNNVSIVKNLDNDYCYNLIIK